jgi:signal transduction histidine kinase/DNA-binding NarL/FixJ family response regulator
VSSGFQTGTGIFRLTLLPIGFVVILFAASFSPIVLSFLHFTNNHYTDANIQLGSAPLYVRRGFSQADHHMTELDLEASRSAGGPWKLYHPSEVEKSAPIMYAPLEGLPKRTFLDPRGRKEEEFSYAIPFFVSPEKREKLSSTTPGLFLNSIGDNWEIYLNGELVRSELHLDGEGRILSHRAWRYPFFPLDRSMIKDGENLLVFRIVGDPSYLCTGFFYKAPYYIDDYLSIRDDHTEFPLFFLCGIYLFVAIYHLMLYIMHSQNRYYIYHSIFSILLGVYFLFRSNAIYQYIPNSAITTKVEYAMVFLMIPVFGIIFEAFDEQLILFPIKGFLVLCALMIPFQIYFSLPFGEDLLKVWQVMGIAFALLYLIVYDVGYRTIVKGYRRWRFMNSGSTPWNFTVDFIKSPTGNLTVGIIFLFAAGVFDIIDSLFLNWGLVATRYSFFIFTIGISLILARDFGRLHNSLTRAIQDLEWVNTNLETTVYNRTKELEIQTQKAEYASRSKSEFLARISHEIRTPLNAIMGLSEIELQKKISVSGTEENLGTIYNSGSMLLSIINEILDISKIEANRFELAKSEYSIESAIADAVNLNLYRIGSKPMVFELKADEKLPAKLLGDELRVKQILNNLLSNAFKYTNEGKVSLSISCEYPEEESRKVLLRFSVSDTGVGIKEEDKDRLFHDYTQFDYRSNRPVEGSGLGLAIAMSLAQMMGGTITVESVFGRGSVFTAILNQERADDSVIGKAAADNLEAIHFSQNLRRKNAGLLRKPMPYGRVLVVDDFESNLAVTRGLLVPYQIHADCISSGQEALEKVRAVGAGRGMPYDLILMDHMMPGMDGIETVRIIREMDSDFARTVPIIALTANASGVQELFLSHGFDGFISKPIDLFVFDGILNQWIRSRHPVEAAEAEAEISSGAETMTDLTETPPHIPGIDLAEGISRYGSEESYLEIVRIFCTQTEAAAEKLLDRRNLNDYTVTVHGLKGSLFGICAAELGNRAAALEKAARDGNSAELEEGTSGFLKELEELISVLKVFLKKSVKAPKGRKEKPESELLARLLAAARNYNNNLMLECLGALEEWDYVSGGSLVSWIREKADEYDYGAIVERLESDWHFEEKE